MKEILPQITAGRVANESNEYIAGLKKMPTKEAIEFLLETLVGTDIEDLKKGIDYMINLYIEKDDKEAFKLITRLLNSLPIRFHEEEVKARTTAEKTIDKLTMYIVQCINEIENKELRNLLNWKLKVSVCQECTDYHSIIENLKNMMNNKPHIAVAAMETLYALKEMLAGDLKQISLSTSQKTEIQEKALELIASDQKNLNNPTRSPLEIISNIVEQYKNGNEDAFALLLKASGAMKSEEEIFEPLSVYTITTLLISNNSELMKVGEVGFIGLMYEFPNETIKFITDTNKSLDKGDRDKVVNITKRCKENPLEILEDIAFLELPHQEVSIAALSMLAKKTDIKENPRFKGIYELAEEEGGNNGSKKRVYEVVKFIFDHH